VGSGVVDVIVGVVTGGAVVIIGELVVAGGVDVIAGPELAGGLGAWVIAGPDVIIGPVEDMLGLPLVTEGAVTVSSSAGDSAEQAQQRARTNQWLLRVVMPSIFRHSKAAGKGPFCPPS
jgi:hypothetical protein